MNKKRMSVFIVDDEYSIVERIQKSIDWELYNFEIVGYSTSAVEAYQYCINLAVFLLKNTRVVHEERNAALQMEYLDILSSSKKMMTWMERFCGRLVHEKEQAEGSLHPVVKYVLQEINTHYMDCTFSVNELAEKVGMSASYLGTLFKQQTGELINDCLSRRRLEKAMELLGVRSLTMREIAAACGFASQNYLNRVFKQKYGLSLTEYRRKLVAEEV